MAALALAGCEGFFDTHPYDTQFGGETELNAKNIALIEEQCAGKDTLRVAFIADTHLWLGDFEDMVDDLNKKPDIDFVVHCGDLTDTGTTKEFAWSRDILNNLQVPYVALIGNHDFLGTGNEVYEEMFGDVDFTFIADSIKFVCVNTNAIEYSYVASVPDFDFLERSVAEDSALYHRTIVVMHAPPYCEVFNNNVAKVFEHYINFFPGLMFCVYGHNHRLEQLDLFDDGLIYYSVDCAEDRNYYVFTITREGYDYEVVYF